MPSRPSQAQQCRGDAGVFCMLILGMISLAFGGCVTTASRDVSLNPDDLTGKAHAWFSEHWGAPRAKSKRFFGGETWVYFRIDGNQYSVPFFDRAPHECQIYLTFDQEGVLEEAAKSGC